MLPSSIAVGFKIVNGVLKVIVLVLKLIALFLVLIKAVLLGGGKVAVGISGFLLKRVHLFLKRVHLLLNLFLHGVKGFNLSVQLNHLRSPFFSPHKAAVCSKDFFTFLYNTLSSEKKQALFTDFFIFFAFTLNKDCISRIFVLFLLKKGGVILEGYEKVSNLSARLSQALAMRKMTQTELADRTGISKQSIHAYVAGHYDAKQLALYKMGRVLDVSEMWLDGYDTTMERTEAQKENDELADVITAIQEKKELRPLVIKISRLSSKKFHIVASLVDSLCEE